MSERTLTRRLTDHGTSFGDEVGRARVDAAKALLRDTDTPVRRIALAVGCASASSFSVLFRRREATTPSAYRAAVLGRARTTKRRKAWRPRKTSLAPPNKARASTSR